MFNINKITGVPTPSGRNAVPVTQPLPGRQAEMAINNSGANVFKLSPFQHLARFLILGTEGGTYYANERDHTVQAVGCLAECISLNFREYIDLIGSISTAGRAKQNDYAIYALAYGLAHAQNPQDAYYARTQVSKVCRTGTHILTLAKFLKEMPGSGMGSGKRRIFQDWFLKKPLDTVAFQYAKYANRNGWTQRDLLRISRPFAKAKEGVVTQEEADKRNNLFNYIAKQGEVTDKELALLPQILIAKKALQDVAETGLTSSNKPLIRQLIIEFRLTAEMVPTELLSSPEVWGWMLPHLGITAIMRNLGRMTANGLLSGKAFNEEVKFVCAALINRELLSAGRVHPLSLYMAFETYKSGHGQKGSLSWTPVPQITAALEAAFFLAFDLVEPTGKNRYLAVDCSGSMQGQYLPGTSVSAMTASAIMAMVTVKSEINAYVVGFGSTLHPIEMTKSSTLDQVYRTMQKFPWANTYCDLPMVTAEAEKLPVDMFEVYTDNETNGVHRMHPSEALKSFRRSSGRPAKLAVIGMTATKFSIADPKDAGMLDFVGFDSSAPAMLAEFAR